MSSANSILRAFLLVFLVAFLLTCVLVARGATPDAESLLRRSDTYRNGWPSYVVHVKITNYESGKSDEEALYEVSQKGTDKTYVEFMSPRDKGRHLLMLGDDMWIYLPDTSRPIRITPLERLSGDASNGDVARTNYAVDYSPVYLRTEKVGTEQCYLLELDAKRKGSTYHRILYWLRVAGRPSGQGRVLSHLGQAHQVGNLRPVSRHRRTAHPPQAHALRRDPP